MRAFIYTGGVIYPDNITAHPEEEDMVVAVDAGYRNALQLGVKKVDVFLGDMDSVGTIQPPDGAEVLQVPAEKNATDTQIAVETTIMRGADQLVIIGGLGGRLDHTMANLGLLEYIHDKHVYVTIEDGRNRVRFLRNDSTLIARSKYKYLGIVSADEKCRGLSIEGCKYPLKNGTLTRKQAYAVSNELTGNCALIAVRKGGIFIIESMDNSSLN